MKSTNNFSNNKPYDPYSYKEDIKIKYNSVKAIVRKFRNETAAMMALLAVTVPAFDWAGYCLLTPDKQLAWGKRSNELTEAMFYLINSKNKQAKKDLCLAYFHRNMTAYLPNIKAMA